jgi:hypothetical protein
MRQTTFKRWLYFLISFRAAVLAICAFLPLSLPGVWRQTDTLGVTLRYWLRWTVEKPWPMPLLPAVLNSGDGSGIMPMEFPLLNVFFAPCFALGPFWGKTLAMLGLLILVQGLIFINARVWKQEGLLFIAVASFSSGWTGKFIPDLVSVLLVLLAVGLGWSEALSKKRQMGCAVLATLGLLMKPTSVVVMILFLAHPKEARKRILSNFSWGLCAVLVAILYYTKGLQFIRLYQEGPALFDVEMRPFAQSVIEFFSDVKNWTNMWLYRAFFSLGAVLILPLAVRAIYQKTEGYRDFLKLWMVFVIQYVLIAGLDGTHGFVHDYYFLPLAPTSALILWWLIIREKAWIRAIIFAGLLIPTLELSSMDLKYLYKNEFRKQIFISKACSDLKSEHPEVPWSSGQVFLSPREEYPTLELCFGERGGGKLGRYGFFWTDSLPVGCKLLGQRESIALVDCRGGRRT